MNAHVLGESRAVCEGLGTNSASVRPLAIMSAHVCRDGRRLGELAIADLALEWLFAGVNSEMSCEIGRL